MKFTLGSRLTAEFIGTAFLVAAVVGSGVMGEKLAGGNVAIALLANTIATGAALVALILAFGAISGAHFNPDTMRMELDSIRDVIFNPVAQSKFVHTVSAGYVTGAIFVLAISAWYLLKGRHLEFAKRSATVALSFGLAAALSVVVLGDESGYTLTQNQKMKIAAVESEWHTEPPPAAIASEVS